MAKKTTKKTTSRPAKKRRKKTTAKAGSPGRTSADTTSKLQSLADRVVKTSLAGREPVINVPTRALSNTNWNKSKRILQMGAAEQERQLFNLNQAKKFMQTMLHANGVKELLEADKTLSLRGMFYKGLHTIQGTKSEKTFDDQTESDTILEDIEVVLGSLREQLHVFADTRGNLVGNVTIVDNGDTIDARRMGTGGWGIPSICEPEIIQFDKCEADFVLHVEKGTVWRRFVEDRFWEKHNCVLTHGSGQPPRGVRRLLRRFNEELELPVLCLLDCDPWGHYIYSVIKQGSISLAFESERLAIPDAKFIGLRAMDYQRYDLSDDVQIALNDRDIARCKQIREYPWFAEKKAWQKEFDQLIRNGFKMEVESLITKDISYVTEVYVPERLEAKDWLD
jgi:DNA topoisomerase-6 subunit A